VEREGGEEEWETRRGTAVRGTQTETFTGAEKAEGRRNGRREGREEEGGRTEVF